MPTIFRDKVTSTPTGVAAVTFNDPSTLPAGAISWGLDVLLPWSNTPELDAEFTSIGSVDGEVSSDFFPAKGKQLAIGGWASAVDRATAESLADLIVRDAFPRNVDLVIARYEATPKFITARRTAPIEFSWVGPYSFRWGTELRAGDPFKYALTPIVGSAGVAGQSSGGRSYPRTYPLQYTTISSGEANRVIVTNTGTADSRKFTITITGPLSKGGWRLVNETTGGILKFDLAISSTDTLVIDFQREIALFNGAPVTATITGDFFPIEPGVNVLKLYGDFDPAADFSVNAYSAWE